MNHSGGSSGAQSRNTRFCMDCAWCSLFMSTRFQPCKTIVLWLIGVWHAERSLIDCAGRVLGAYWAANSVLALVLLYLFMV